MYVKVNDKKTRDNDPEIIIWKRENQKGLERKIVYSFPQPEDNIKKKKFFAVKDYEKALFYNKGSLIGVLSGGVYKLEKEAKIKGTEIVWIDTSLIEIPWGIPKKHGIPTKEGCMVGLHGDLKLRINDAKIFYNDVVAGKKEWTIQDLKEWIMSLLLTSIRDIFKLHYTNRIILEDREKVIQRVTAKITEEFALYGLELESFNIIGLKTPEDFNQIKVNIIQQRKNLVKRISELKTKKEEIENELLDNKITQEEFEFKKAQISKFIAEAQEELRRLDTGPPNS
ncbi:MAG: SPFH domain-containing protein [Candidatus Helarchaeota archaeon]